MDLCAGQLLAIPAEGENIVHPFGREACRQIVLEFFHQQGDPLLTPATMANRIFHLHLGAVAAGTACLA